MFRIVSAAPYVVYTVTGAPKALYMCMQLRSVGAAALLVPKSCHFTRKTSVYIYMFYSTILRKIWYPYPFEMSLLILKNKMSRKIKLNNPFRKIQTKTNFDEFKFCIIVCSANVQCKK